MERSCSFQENLAVVLEFLTLQNKHVLSVPCQ